jgi:hypothetical protein
MEKPAKGRWSADRQSEYSASQQWCQKGIDTINGSYALARLWAITASATYTEEEFRRSEGLSGV